MLVEYFRCWSDKTWDTDFITLPHDTHESKMQEALDEAISKLKWKDDNAPDFVGIYHVPQEEDEDLDMRAVKVIELFDSVFSNTESIEVDNIGADLAYLMNAILSDEKCEWDKERPFVKLLKQLLATDDPVWDKIQIIEED